ncbi:MAG: hypothetical protein IIZ65_06310, partial [Clostridia bacterium]|nr:hypothetical protein [Clostridia bacterium]
KTPSGDIPSPPFDTYCTQEKSCLGERLFSVVLSSFSKHNTPSVETVPLEMVQWFWQCSKRSTKTEGEHKNV